jgi:hypothetical protein
MANTKFKITIKRVIEEEFEMILGCNSIVEALDEARLLISKRNKTNKVGQFYLTKIETKRN